MKAGQGKNKGSSFERHIGSELSLWLSRGARKDLICRTVGSGAQFTVTKGKGNPGDLMSQDKISYEFFRRYVVECKHWKTLNMHHFLQGKGNLWDAWEKVKKEAEQMSRLPWLIARQNHQPDLLICYPQDMHREYLTNGHFPNYHLLFKSTIQIYELKEFLTSVDSEKYLQ